MKFGDDRESQRRGKGGEAAVYFTMLASEMWSMLATSIAMATFTGGPVGGEVRKESTPAPSPLHKHAHAHTNAPSLNP